MDPQQAPEIPLLEAGTNLAEAGYPRSLHFVIWLCGRTEIWGVGPRHQETFQKRSLMALNECL